MSKFSDYIKEEHTTINQINKEKIDENNITNLLEKYSSLSHDQLMSEFVKASKKKKEEGGLSDGECEKLTNALSPYLNDQQKSMMASLLQRGKNA